VLATNLAENVSKKPSEFGANGIGADHPWGHGAGLDNFGLCRFMGSDFKIVFVRLFSPNGHIYQYIRILVAKHFFFSSMYHFSVQMVKVKNFAAEPVTADSSRTLPCLGARPSPWSTVSRLLPCPKTFAFLEALFPLLFACTKAWPAIRRFQDSEHRRRHRCNH
jgi:hypothetical protein